MFRVSIQNVWEVYTSPLSMNWCKLTSLYFAFWSLFVAVCSLYKDCFGFLKRLYNGKQHVFVGYKYSIMQNKHSSSKRDRKHTRGTFHWPQLKKKTVKVTLRSAANPRQALSGHSADTHISFGTLEGQSNYRHITHLIHMDTFNSHMGLSWDACSVMCLVTVNVWWWTCKCSKVSCHGVPQN